MPDSTERLNYLLWDDNENSFYQQYENCDGMLLNVLIYGLFDLAQYLLNYGAGNNKCIC